MMKRVIYSTIAAMLMLCGCEYHPYYDGQPLRIYNYEYGIIEADGVHINVPIVSRREFEISIYGGKGKNHNVAVDNQELFSYTYEEAAVEGGLMGDGVVPATITITPHQLGETSMTISDEDTGESIQLFVHVVKTFSKIEIIDTQNSLPVGTCFAFEYGIKSDVVKICRQGDQTDDFEYLYDAHFRFLQDDKAFEFELTYLADQNGVPDVNGSEVIRRFLVEYMAYEGYERVYGIYMMNLDYLPVQTRGYIEFPDVQYRENFRFIDITDNPNPDPESPETKIFYAESATLMPWKY